jgi:hypothetical protein
MRIAVSAPPSCGPDAEVNSIPAAGPSDVSVAQDLMPIVDAYRTRIDVDKAVTRAVVPLGCESANVIIDVPLHDMDVLGAAPRTDWNTSRVVGASGEKLACVAEQTPISSANRARAGRARLGQRYRFRDGAFDTGREVTFRFPKYGQTTMSLSDFGQLY